MPSINLFPLPSPATTAPLPPPPVWRGRAKSPLSLLSAFGYLDSTLSPPGLHCSRSGVYYITTSSSRWTHGCPRVYTAYALCSSAAVIASENTVCRTRASLLTSPRCSLLLLSAAAARRSLLAHELLQLLKMDALRYGTTGGLILITRRFSNGLRATHGAFPVLPRE